jgi:hypothetical protein
VPLSESGILENSMDMDIQDIPGYPKKKFKKSKGNPEI